VDVGAKNNFCSDCGTADEGSADGFEWWSLMGKRAAGFCSDEDFFVQG
jgi:hypothetical protein